MRNDARTELSEMGPFGESSRADERSSLEEAVERSLRDLEFELGTPWEPWSPKLCTD